jgi:ornithine carbamoyltransferase
VKDRLFAWTGDGNNVLHSLVEASARFSFRLNIAVPEGSEPDARYIAWSNANGGQVQLMRSPDEAVGGADCVVTDTWVSMGQEHRARGHNVFQPYQVNAELMRLASPDALFMHCLPAHRGEEVTDEVIDGPHSVVFDEAENRLHAQKAVLAWCLGA